jgi:hypothetical protein
LIFIPVPDGRIFRRDGDAPFFFQIHGIHDPVLHDLMRPERAGLPEHGVNQGGLAVIDMGDNRNISDICFSHRHPIKLMRILLKRSGS